MSQFKFPQGRWGRNKLSEGLCIYAGRWDGGDGLLLAVVTDDY